MKNLFKKIKAWTISIKYFIFKKTMPQAPEFVIGFDNPTNEVKKCVLFGANIFFLEKNFGSEEGVVVSNFMGPTYSFLLNNMLGYFFGMIIGKIRISSVNKLNQNQIIEIVRSDIYGAKKTTPISLFKWMDAYQQQSDIIESPFSNRFFFNGNTYFEFTLQPNSSMVFSLYPTLIREASPLIKNNK